MKFYYLYTTPFEASWIETVMIITTYSFFVISLLLANERYAESKVRGFTRYESMKHGFLAFLLLIT